MIIRKTHLVPERENQIIRGDRLTLLEPSSTDGSNTDNQANKPAIEAQQENTQTEDVPAQKIDEEQKNLNSVPQTSAPAKRQRGAGTGFPGYRGQGGTGYPQHRQYGSPPLYPAVDQAQKTPQSISNAESSAKSPENQATKNTTSNVGTDKRRELLHAAGFGDITAVNKLLKDGANPNARAKDRTSRTALILAAAGGHMEIVDALLASGAKVDEKDLTGHTALNWAAMRGHTTVVSALMKKGADINTQDNGKVSPLLYAVGTHNIPLVKLLVENGADLEVESRENKMTPLLLAIEHKDIQSLDILIKKGAKVSEKNRAIIEKIKAGNKSE